LIRLKSDPAELALNIRRPMPLTLRALHAREQNFTRGLSAISSRAFSLMTIFSVVKMNKSANLLKQRKELKR